MNFLQKLFGMPDLEGLLENGAVVIDVRTKAEFQAERGSNSVNIPLDEISRNIEKIRKYNKPVITVCRSGARSGSAASILSNQGIEAVNGGPWQNVERVVMK